MHKITMGVCIILLLGNLGISGCASEGRQRGELTARAVAECTMESLKRGDLERFNACTDNYVETYYNWMGVPVEKEYRVFNELLQPGIKVGKWKKRYDYNRKLTGKMMERLEWEIVDIKEEEDRAEIMMEITNLNMCDVMGKYEISLLSSMLESEGTGLMQMLKDLSRITDDEKGLLPIVEACDEEDLCTNRVTVMAYRDLDRRTWRLHLDDEFINAFMGNINSDEYSEKVEKQRAQLEEQFNEKMDNWEEDFENQVEWWAEKFVW